MFCEEVDPLPRAFDPERCPALVVEQPLLGLPIQACEFGGARRGVEFDPLHQDPLSSDESQLDRPFPKRSEPACCYGLCFVRE